MNQRIKYGLAGISVLVLLACSGETGTQKYDYDDRSIEDRMGDIESNMVMPETTTKAEELMYIMKVDAPMKGMMTIMGDQMVDVAKAADPNINEAELKWILEISQEELDEMLPEFISEIALIYNKYLTDDEIQAAIDFYKTPAGQKFITNQTAMMQEGMIVGQNIVPELQSRIDKRMREKLE